MKKYISFSLIMVLGLVLSACGSATIFATPTATPTQPKPTSTPTATHTPSPTPTQTITPTPIGGSEPIVAFVGKDSQGNYGLYVDSFYTRRPKKIAPVPVFVNDRGFPYTYVPMRWSSEGKKLIFVNGELTKRSFFLFDTITGEVREIAKVPNGQNPFGELIWSQDGNEIFFSAASPGSRASHYWKLDLVSGKFTEITNEYYVVNSYFHVNSPINCNNSLPSIKSIKSFDHNNELDKVCFYPDLNSHGALKRNKESTDLVLLSANGEVDKILVKFPAGFYTNGWIGLSLSPDKTQILIVGDGGIGVTGHLFVYLAQLISLPLDKSDPKLFQEYDPSQEMRIHVYGWSPDSQDYLIASGSESDYKLAVIQAASGNILSEYRIPSEIEPAILIYQSVIGIEMIWPSKP